MKNKWLKLCAVVMMLFTFVGMSASKVANAETPEVQSVNIADLTKEQREAIQPGEPTAPAQAGQATLYVYELDKGKCPLGDTLPNTGSSSTTILAVFGIVALSGAAYFVVSNKKAKKTILMIGLVAAGTVAATTSVSAATPYEQSLIDMSCYRYVGYIREDVSMTTEATTTTEAAANEEVVTPEEATITVETTTTETTTTTTTESTTAEPTTETAATQSVEPITVSPTDHL
jgi:zinc metalloprotease zmpB